MKPGDKKTILNQDLNDNPIIEGQATLINLIRESGYFLQHAQWYVQFDGENEIVTRFIYSDEEVAKVEADLPAYLRKQDGGAGEG